MSEDVQMTAKTSFYGTGIGSIDNGQTFSVSESRAQELERNGVAERAGAKSDPAPQNKMEPDALDTGDDEQPKRSAGRPRKVKVEESDDAVSE